MLLLCVCVFKVDSAKLSKSVFDALKADSSIINQAYSFHIATLLAEEEAKKFYEGVEEILEQADEVDKTILQVMMHRSSFVCSIVLDYCVF